MPITIRKDEDGIKFYGSDPIPIVVIYNNTKVAMLRDMIMDDDKLIVEISQAIRIAGLFIYSLNASETVYKKNNIKITYLSQIDLVPEDKLYSPRKILRWVESDKIVTVNKKNRVKYQFTQFAFQDDKLIILYKPVIW